MRVCECERERAREREREGETTTAKVGQRVGQPEHTGVVAEGGEGVGGDARCCENEQVTGCVQLPENC